MYTPQLSGQSQSLVNAKKPNCTNIFIDKDFDQKTFYQERIMERRETAVKLG